MVVYDNVWHTLSRIGNDLFLFKNFVLAVFELVN